MIIAWDLLPTRFVDNKSCWSLTTRNVEIYNNIWIKYSYILYKSSNATYMPCCYLVFVIHNVITALCGYPLVKMELDIQTRFLPRLPFSCNSIISDKIWRKMSLSLSIFLVLPQISLVKYYETIKILMQIFWYFRSHFHNVAGPGEKSYFEVFFSA